uniref:Uncharacterized protein n=1 Tax=Aegilops tauschii subsp. strangulata TaxID=200361 RepID=A0A453KMR2_AEGTS
MDLQRPASLASVCLRSGRLDLHPISSSPGRYPHQWAGPLPAVVHRSSRARCRWTKLVSRTIQQDRARLAHGAAGLTSSPSRCCRTELVSRLGQQDGSVDASSGRPIGSRRWGLPRGAKGGTFPLVPFVGVRRVSGEVVSRSWILGRRPWWWLRGALGQSPCLGAARSPWSCGRRGCRGVAFGGGEYWPR